MFNEKSIISPKFHTLLFDCLFTFNTTPIALMKTTKLVEPALINGNGSPVGGIEPDTTSYCTKNPGSFLHNLQILLELKVFHFLENIPSN